MSKRIRTLFGKPKSKRLAKIISIVSPAAFKRAIRILAKSGFTLQEIRALRLAKNRAKAMLNRKDLSAKERKQMRIISKMRIPTNVWRPTTKNDGHRHRWRRQSRFTSRSDGHTHIVNLNMRLAIPNVIGGHKHKLI